MRKIILTAVFGAGALALAGCSQETRQKASQTLDSASADAQANADSAGENIDNAAKAAGAAVSTAADKAGAAVSTAAGKATEKVRNTTITIHTGDRDAKTDSSQD